MVQTTLRPLGSSLLLPGVIAFVFFLPLAANAGEQKSLYERLGGYDAISAVVDVFLEKVWADPEIERFFIGMGTDTRNQLRQKNKNLLCYNTGGPCKKINRPLKQAHAGLGLTDKDFDIVVGGWVAILAQGTARSPCFTEYSVISALLVKFIFSRMRARWVLTVVELIQSSSAIDFNDRPAAMKQNT